MFEREWSCLCTSLNLELKISFSFQRCFFPKLGGRQDQRMSSQWDAGRPAGPRCHPQGPGSDKTPGVRPLAGERGGEEATPPDSLSGGSPALAHFHTRWRRGCACQPAPPGRRGGRRLRKANLWGPGAPSRRKTFLQFLECKFLSHPTPCSYCPSRTLLFFLLRCYQSIMFISCKGAVTAAVELTIYGRLDRCWQSVGEHGHFVVGAPGLVPALGPPATRQVLHRQCVTRGTSAVVSFHFKLLWPPSTLVLLHRPIPASCRPLPSPFHSELRASRHILQPFLKGATNLSLSLFFFMNLPLEFTPTWISL